MNHPFFIAKSDGTKELFDEQKLINSLKRSGASNEAIKHVTDEIEKTMHDGLTTADIYARAFNLLKQHHPPVAIKYSIRRALFELGPDGFPFEKFVSRIFQVWGYETLTDQMLMGHCVEHEMDVIAWKGQELALVEAKFHHELGLRSDLKVALYVKARFDDLSSTVFDYGGKSRKLSSDGRWLITNTKFTDVAIKYSLCAKTNLVGWNYPAKNNLHQIIEENGLHPITCISALSPMEKKNLIGQNILTCLDIIGKPQILTKIGIKTDAAEKVLTEAQFIVKQAK